jgi:hypothetical protein
VLIKTVSWIQAIICRKWHYRRTFCTSRVITINPLTPNDLYRRRTVNSLNIKISSKKLGRQQCAEGFNSGVKRLTIDLKFPRVPLSNILIMVYNCFMSIGLKYIYPEQFP